MSRNFAGMLLGSVLNHEMYLHEQVSTLIRETSEKYVPKRGKNDILLDAIIGLWRFSNSCR
jgi:transcription termination factor Rho